MKKLFSALSFYMILFGEALHGASLIGDRASLQKQNLVADREGLVRIKDDSDLDDMKRRGILVKLPDAIKVDYRMDQKWQWVLERTAAFLEDYGITFINKFGRFMQVNSAVRTIPRQLEIIKSLNFNAAPIEGDRMSPHLTGATVDIAKFGMNKDELEWMRNRLLTLEELELIEATEEWNQSVFHIMVYQTYVEKP